MSQLVSAAVDRFGRLDVMICNAGFGIYGTIDSLSEDSVIIKVEGGGILRVARGSIALRREEQQQQDTGKK